MASLGAHFTDLQLDAAAVGNGISLSVDQGGGAILVVTGTFAATIIPEVTIDGTNWFSVEAQGLSTGTKVTSITAAGSFVVAAPGAVSVRARISAYTSGTVTVQGRKVVVALILPTGGAGGGGGGTEYVDKAAFTEGVSGGVKPAGAVFNDTITADPAEDAITPLRITVKKGLHVNLRNAAGTEIGTVANPVQVTGGGGGTEYADKAAFTEGTSGGVKPSGAVFNDTITADPLEDQITPLRITAKKGLHSNLRNAAGAEIGIAAAPLRTDPTGTTTQPVNDAAGSLTVDAPVGTPVAARLSDGAAFIDPRDVSDRAARLVGQTEGRAAHGVAVAGNPNLIAARANLNEPATVADGQAVSLWADQFGRLVVVAGHANPEPPVTVNATTVAATQVIAAPGVGLSLYIHKGIVSNRAAAKVLLTLNDGATARWTQSLAADGGGARFDFGSRGWKLTANTALNVTLDAAGNVQVNIEEYSIAA